VSLLQTRGMTNTRSKIKAEENGTVTVAAEPPKPYNLRQRPAPKETENGHAADNTTHLKHNGKHASAKDTDHSHVNEFGGPWGTAIIMIGSHLFIYYIYVSLFFFNGSVPRAGQDEQTGAFLYRIATLVYTHAFPNLKAWTIYVSFILFQLLLALTMPGVISKGLPVPSEGYKELEYRCNGVFSWYVTLITVLALHYSGLFPLQTVMDEFGPILSVSTIISNIVSVLAYVSAIMLKKQHRMSGNLVYDFFMGAWLNPRVGIFDFKFWAETRVAWITLFLLTLSAAMKQVELEGRIGAPMWFMLAAHGIYTNAVMKGEECIVTTWDVFYEKWGWMLIFWNFTGVPFFYCAQSFYIAINHKLDHVHPAFSVFLFCTLFGAYYIWDTSQSQKDRFRMQLEGNLIIRKTFPQLPWGTLKNPKYLTTKAGSPLLIDGWWKYARKIHYSMDTIMALTWGLTCGFDNLLPYFYFFFFSAMIAHRYSRDAERCRRKYGDDWTRYEQAVPYVFIPYVF